MSVSVLYRESLAYMWLYLIIQADWALWVNAADWARFVVCLFLVPLHHYLRLLYSSAHICFLLSWMKLAPLV